MRDGKLFQNPSSEKSSIILDEKAFLQDNGKTLLLMREKELKEITDAITPLLNNRNGDNLFIHGPSGSGKLSLMEYIIGKLAKETSKILPVYVNCWEHPTQMGIYSKVIEALDMPIPRRGYATDEVFARILERLDTDGISILLVLDKVHGLLQRGDENLFHAIARANEGRRPRFNIIGISADRNALEKLSAQARSSMNFATLEFEEYTEKHLFEILEERAENALAADAWSDETLSACAKMGCANGGNARLALEILRRAAKLAEKRGVRRIEVSDVEKASSKTDYAKSLIEGGLEDAAMSQYGLTDDEKLALRIIAEKGEIGSSALYVEFKQKKDLCNRQIRNHLRGLEEKRLIQTTLVDSPGMLKEKMIQLR